MSRRFVIEATLDGQLARKAYNDFETPVEAFFSCLKDSFPGASFEHLHWRMVSLPPKDLLDDDGLSLGPHDCFLADAGKFGGFTIYQKDSIATE
jgi:hypothetical protein